MIVQTAQPKPALPPAKRRNASGQLIRTYSFNGVPVGTAVVEAVETANDTAVADGEAHLQEAKEFGESRSYLPYVAIGGIGLAILIFLIYRIVKIIRA